MKMRASILILFFMSLEVQGVCLPESPLMNKKMSMNNNAALVKMEESVYRFQEIIGPILPNDHDLIVKLETLNPRVNALINKLETNLVIEVYGGVLSHPDINESTLMLLLCHEIGHYLGGAPFQSRGGWSSTEGQADYYSSSDCAHFMGLNESSFLDAALRLTKIYAEVTREAAPVLDSCDERVSNRTNFGYPPIQCRLDTLIAGWRGQSRPKCWFKEI